MSMQVQLFTILVQLPKIAGDRVTPTPLCCHHNLESRPNSCQLATHVHWLLSASVNTCKDHGTVRIAIIIGNDRQAEKRGGTCLRCLYGSYAHGNTTDNSLPVSAAALIDNVHYTLVRSFPANHHC